MTNNERYQSNSHAYKITLRRLINDQTYVVYHRARSTNEAMSIANKHSFESSSIIEVVDETTSEIVYPLKPKQNITPQFFDIKRPTPSVSRIFNNQSASIYKAPSVSRIFNNQTTYTKNTPYNYPPITDLSMPAPATKGCHADDIRISQKIEEVLATFRVPSQIVHITHGPAITRFELELTPGKKIQRITELKNEIAYNIGVNSIRIIAPIPGKKLVGIEIPNWTIETITLREILSSEIMLSEKSKLAIALGKNKIGQPIICDIEKMPHILLAGQTGSGKSICIHSIILSLLYRTTPNEVNLILIDTRIVELQCYNGLPHLMMPVINDPYKMIAALTFIIEIMKERYDNLSKKNAYDIDSYNKNLNPFEKTMPKIIIIIDGYDDLDDTTNIMELLKKITNDGAKVGIHLIVSSQHPSFGNMNGTLKINLPCRIAFRTSSHSDSQIILGRPGAENLLGSGNMLFFPKGALEPIWLQGCFISHEEIMKVTKHVRETNPCTYDSTILKRIEQIAAKNYEQTNHNNLSEEIENKNLYDQAIQIAIDDGQISVSTLQRRLKIGYSRANRLLDEMEYNGIIEHKNGHKPQKCLIKPNTRHFTPNLDQKSVKEQSTIKKQQGAQKKNDSNVFSDWIDQILLK